MVAYKADELWGIKDNGSVVQIVGGKEIKRAEIGTAQSIGVGADGSIWMTCKETFRAAKGINLMYYDFLSSKFIAETKAHLYCKDLAVLPNGIPLMITENGELFILINREKYLGIPAGGTELVRVMND